MNNGTYQARNLTDICLSEHQMAVHGTNLEFALQRYVYPAIAICGILGNSLNLTVLMNRNMRSRANTFLAVLAFADIIFLTLLLPNVLANYKLFGLNYYFRWFYFHTKVHLLAMANWCSAVAIWCVIAVCTDRLVGIRSPLYSRASWSWWAMPLIIIGIIFVCGLLTFYQHFEYLCLVRTYCSGTQIYSKCQSLHGDGWFGNGKNPFSEQVRSFLSLCVLLHAILMVIVPIALLTLLNFSLLCALRRRHRHLAIGDASERRANETQMQKTENRVTLTVAFIVTMFTVTNGPSACMHLLRTAYQLKPSEFYDETMICSTLVICGKASNFILFCLGSKHFRSRLLRLTQKKMNKKFESITASLVLGSSKAHGKESFRRQSSPSCRSSLSTMTALPIKPKTRTLSNVDLYRPLVDKPKLSQ